MMAEADYDSEDEAFLKTYDDVPKPVDTSQLASEGLRSRAALALRSGDAVEWQAACSILAASAYTGEQPDALIAAVAEIRLVAKSHPSAKTLLVGSTALATGLAGALRPMSERVCLSEAHIAAGYSPNLPDADGLAAAESVLWLLGWLLPTSRNAAVLHVRGDATLLVRLARTGGSRPLRRAAIVDLTLLHLADGAPADAASLATMLVESLELCIPHLAHHASGLPPASSHDYDPVWQSSSSLAALSNLFAGRACEHIDAAGDAGGSGFAMPATAGVLTIHAAMEAFLKANGVLACKQILQACANAFSKDEAAAAVDTGADKPSPVAILQAEALWIFRAVIRTLSSFLRGATHLLSTRCWEMLGKSDGLTNMLKSTGLLSSGHASAALSALLELSSTTCDAAAAAASESTTQSSAPSAAAASIVLSLLPSLGAPGLTIPLLERLYEIACRSEASAISLGKAGVGVTALDILSAASWPPTSAVTASEHGTIRLLLHRLLIHVSRVWAHPSTLRSLLHTASAMEEGDGDKRSSSGPLALLVASCRPLAGPSLPYVWLTPGGGSASRSLAVEVQERAWPPAHAYSIGCWVRRPLRSRSSSSGAGGGGEDDDTDAADEPFALFELETTDERSYTGAFLRDLGNGKAEITVQAGSSRRLSRCRVSFPFARGQWHWLCVVHERRRPLPASQLTIYVDGIVMQRSTLSYPTFDCCHTLSGHLGYEPTAAAAAAASASGGASTDPMIPLGWHLGPCFGAEILLTDANVREACCTAWCSPYLAAATAEGYNDELKFECRQCWKQSSLSPSTGAASTPASEASSPLSGSGGGGGVGGGDASELRIPPSKAFFLMNTLGGETTTITPQQQQPTPQQQPAAATPPADGETPPPPPEPQPKSPASSSSPSLILPRRLASLLPAAGGSSALLKLVQSSNDTTSLLLSLRLVNDVLSGAPMNAHLFGEQGCFGLRLALRTKLPLLTEAVCDLLLSMCTKESSGYALASSVGVPSRDNLDAALEALITGEVEGEAAVVEEKDGDISAGASAPAAADDAGSSSSRLTSLICAQSGVLSNPTLLRIVMLDGTLWSSAPHRVQRHWLQKLHSLLTEDSTGAMNAQSLIDCGLLDCMMGLLGSGALVASGSHLLAARLLLRTWHSIEFSPELTQRVQDFLAATCEPAFADVQLLCLRMLMKMSLHARKALEDNDSPAARLARQQQQHDASKATRASINEPESAAAAAIASSPSVGRLTEVPHDGARAVLAVLQPALLLTFLQPGNAITPKAVILVMRLLVFLLLLSHAFPEAVPFERAFKQARGVERLSVLLPFHSTIPDIYRSLIALAVGVPPGPIERDPPPENAEQLSEACGALIARSSAAASSSTKEPPPSSTPSSKSSSSSSGGSTTSSQNPFEWAPASLSIISLIGKEGLRINSAAPLAPPPPSSSATPRKKPDNGGGDAAAMEVVEEPVDVSDAAASPAAATPPPSTPSVPFAEVLHLFVSVIPSMLTLLQRKTVMDTALLTPQSDLPWRVCSAFGSVWLFARLASGDGGSETDDDVLAIEAQQMKAAAPAASNIDKLAAAPSIAINSLATLTSTAILESPSLLTTTAGSAHLDVLLDPLPSLTRSGLAFNTWLTFRSSLLREIIKKLHAGLSSRSRPLIEAHAKALALLYKQLIRLQAVALFPSSSKQGDGASKGRGSDCERVLPHSELLQLALILVERGVGEGGNTLMNRARDVKEALGEKGHAAVSNLVSWGRGFMAKHTGKDGSAGSSTAASASTASTTTTSSDGGASTSSRPKAPRSDAPLVLSLALRLLSTRFLALEYLSALDAAAVLPLLGDVAMVLTTLASDSDDASSGGGTSGGASASAASLESHRAVVGALAWRLLSLFRHSDKDVQRGAISQWVALMGRTSKWLERFAFKDKDGEVHPLVFDWQPLHHNHLAPSSYESWVEAHYAIDGVASKLLDSTLGAHGRDEEEYMRSEADHWVMSFTKEQTSRAGSEASHQRESKKELDEAASSAKSVKDGCSRAVERRQRAVRGAESARDADHGRALKLSMARYDLACSAFIAEDEKEEDDDVSKMSLLRRPAKWALNASVVSDHFTRRKLERLPEGAVIGGTGTTDACNAPPSTPSNSQRSNSSSSQPPSPTTPSQAAERLSVLYDCAQLRSSNDVFAVSHVHGLDAAPGLLALMPGCVALLYGYELAEEDSSGFATAKLLKSGSGGGSSSGLFSPPPPALVPTATAAGATGVGIDQAQRERYRRISNAEIAEVVKRRYQLQPWALQLLLRDGETILLSVSAGETVRDKLVSRLASLIPKAAQSADGHTTADGAPKGAAAGGGGGGTERSSWASALSSELTLLTDGWQRQSERGQERHG